MLGDRLPDSIDQVGLAAARRHSLAPLLLGMAREQGVQLDSNHANRLGMSDLQSQAKSQRQGQAIARLSSLAEGVGVEVCVIKGLWNATSLYPAVGFRPSGDVDLYVGHWTSAARRSIFEELEVDPERINAVEELAERSTPIHEVKVVTSDGLPNMDFHFNPLGFVEPTKMAVRDHLIHRNLPDIGVVLGPRPELGLLIALSNISRDRRANLLSVADAVRLINGAAGEFDWPTFWKIAAEDDLHLSLIHI